MLAPFDHATKQQAESMLLCGRYMIRIYNVADVAVPLHVKASNSIEPRTNSE